MTDPGIIIKIGRSLGSIHNTYGDTGLPNVFGLGEIFEGTIGGTAAILDAMLLQTIGWLRSIGTPSHVTHLLARVLESQYRKFRPGQTLEATTLPTPEMTDTMFAFPEYLMTDFYNYNDDTVGRWPGWQDIN